MHTHARALASHQGKPRRAHTHTLITRPPIQAYIQTSLQANRAIKHAREPETRGNARARGGACVRAHSTRGSHEAQDLPPVYRRHALTRTPTARASAGAGPAAHV
ncbi:MAG: hypothetical protein ACK56I_31720, partial [bacterium]